VDDLFAPTSASDAPAADAPLAARMRPRSLDEFAGQEHILGPGRLLRRAIEADRLTSVILWGPPGTGKTTLAQIVAATTRSPFERMNAVESTVADIRRVVAAAGARRANGGRPTTLFVDEIHRFNKAQQDALLPDVEAGTLRLIGATTFNPFFYVTSALVSRSQVFSLEALPVAALRAVLTRALSDAERGLGGRGVAVDEGALEFLCVQADGDARKALNALELAVATTPADADGTIHVTAGIAEECIQRKAVVYDRDGDAHYDTISAFIKSLRGGDPDAGLYWLAKMLHAGEDPRFIARRLVILASEDVGLADSSGLLVAVAAQQAVETIGMPEARINLAHATVYLATAPKSNRAYAGLESALRDVREGVTLPVPAHLKNAPVKGMKEMGHGRGYQYPHDAESGFVAQAYLAEGRRYYEPTDHGMEKRIRERLEHWRAEFERARGEVPGSEARD
jgi:putative ATPase